MRPPPNSESFRLVDANDSDIILSLKGLLHYLVIICSGWDLNPSRRSESPT